jgi:hypothetical protein
LGVDEIPDWFPGHVYGYKGKIECSICDEKYEIKMKAYQGDFIIKGTQGEIYSFKEEIFKATYEPETK